MLIVGEDDVSKDAVSFRFRDGTQENGVPVDDAVARLVAAVQPGAPEGTA
jgi:threonyl-tRNA synthetase